MQPCAKDWYHAISFLSMNVAIKNVTIKKSSKAKTSGNRISVNDAPLSSTSFKASVE